MPEPGDPRAPPDHPLGIPTAQIVGARARRVGSVGLVAERPVGDLAWLPRSLCGGVLVVRWARAAGLTGITATSSTWCLANPADRGHRGRTRADQITESALARQRLAPTPGEGAGPNGGVLHAQRLGSQPRPWIGVPQACAPCARQRQGGPQCLSARVSWPDVRSTRVLYDFELEPEVRDWLDSLSDSDFKRVDEVCGMLARSGTNLGGPWSDHLDGAVWELHDQRQIDRAVRAQKLRESDHHGPAAGIYERQV